MRIREEEYVVTINNGTAKQNMRYSKTWYTQNNKVQTINTYGKVRAKNK